MAYLLNSPTSIDCVRETIVFVTDVPMLAPIMIGIASCTEITASKQNVLKDWRL